MHGISTKKVIGGKLLRIKTLFNTKFTSVQITGDFFLHPEEKIMEIEKSLVGLSTAEKKESITQKLQNFIQQNQIELVGISPEDIAETLLETLKGGSE